MSKRHKEVNVSKRYLEPTDPDAFVDFPEPLMHLHEPYKGVLPEGHVLCPKCKGYGGWNLVLNAYPRDKSVAKSIRQRLKEMPIGNLRSDMTDAEFRHAYEHFRASCSQCNGWGYVEAESQDATCLHEWDMVPTGTMCLTNWVCKKCGRSRLVDSSD